METPYQCEFCKKYFSSKSTLNVHIKKAKYCIKIRMEIDVPETNATKLMVMERIIQEQMIEIQNLKQRDRR